MHYVELPLFWAMALAAVATVVLFALFTYMAGSKSLLFAFGTVASAVIYFGLTIWSDLRPNSEQRSFAAVFELNHDAPSVRLPMKGPLQPIAIDASYWLYRTNRAAFKDDKSLLPDLVTYEICAFLFVSFVDWKAMRFSVESPMEEIGVLRFRQRARKNPPDSSIISKASVLEQLRASGSVFAGARIVSSGDNLNLPPNSTITVERRSVTVTTPFCAVRFSPTEEIEPFMSGGEAMPPPSVVDPQSPPEVPTAFPGGFDTPMPDEEGWMTRNLHGRRTTYAVQVMAETTYSALRAEHTAMAMHRDFCRELVDQAREWFAHPRSH